MPSIIFYPIDFIYNPEELQIENGLLKLFLQSAELPFTEDFMDDTDSIYDSTKFEFSGGKGQQIARILTTDQTFAASFYSSINAQLGLGDLIGTAYGGATITNNMLDLSTVPAKYVIFDADLNADSQQMGCIMVKVIPNYSGNPVQPQYFFCICADINDATNLITVYHNNNGSLYIWIKDQNNNTIFQANEGIWNPIQGNTYFFQFNYDFNTGNTRLYINGVQFGVTHTQTCIRSSFINAFLIGRFVTTVTNQYWFCDGIAVFSIPQSVVSDFSINVCPNYTYPETQVILPEMEHTLDGSILSFESFETIEGNEPHYTLQIGRSGDYLYWNGLSWVVSNNTYDQANNVSIFNANVGSLLVLGEKYGQFACFFKEQDNQGFIDSLTANMVVNTYYIASNPSAISNISFQADGLEAIIAETVILGLDNIKWILIQDNTEYWFNGSIWIPSNGTYDESNFIGDIDANKESFLIEGYGKSIKLKIFFHTDDGTTSPTFENISIDFNFYGDLPELTQVHIWGFLRDLFIAKENDIIQIRPSWTIGDKTIITGNWKIINTYNYGYFEAICTIEENFIPDHLEWKIGNKIYKTDFVNKSNIKFSELTILEQNEG